MKYALCIHFRCQRQPNHQKKQNGEKRKGAGEGKTQRQGTYPKPVCLLIFLILKIVYI